jgi:hypothetical protein
MISEAHIHTSGKDQNGKQGIFEMKDWLDKSLCFECAKKLGANINIGRQFKGRCQRCHSEQTLFRVTAVPEAPPPGETGICPECAHPSGTHATSCSRSETGRLKREREEIIRALEETHGYDPDRPLSVQIRKILEKALNKDF